MKKTIIMALAGLTATITAAQTMPADTLVNIRDASSVTVTEHSGEMNVEIIRCSPGDTVVDNITRSLDNAVVKQRRWNSPILSTPMSNSSRFDLTVGGPGIGWINSVGQPDGMGLEMGKSLEVSWLNMIAIKYRMPHSVLSVGFGFDWRNYRISTGAHRLTMTDGGNVGLAPYPEGSTPHGSRLKVFGMGVPVLWSQFLPIRWLDGRNLTLTAGAVFNYNSHASLLTKWTTPDGKEASEKCNHIGQRRFSIDFIGLISIGWGLNAYVRYSPNTVLRGAGQPRFKPFSTGLMFMY